jgi:uncharacterized protein
MLFVILSRDVPNSLPKRLPVRPAHLERVKTLQSEGRLVLAGPFPAIEANDPGEAGFTGSMIVAEFANAAAARIWANADPYVAAGVYQSVEILPFKQVLP